MRNILVTGSAGFIGRHLVEALRRRQDMRVIGYDVGNTPADLDRGLAEADVIFHLAGVNRPQRPEEFKTGNADFTSHICDALSALGRKPTFVLSSSIQAELVNPYGVSKREAEKALESWALENQKAENKQQKVESGEPITESRKQKAENGNDGPQAIIFRLKNVFGKWCRPNYNSVTATFCHNIAHDLPITISDPNRELDLVYIDDVIAAFIGVLEKIESRNLKSEIPGHGPLATDVRSPNPGCFEYREVARSFKITLGDLVGRIRSFKESRRNLLLPDMADELTRKLYVTYLSYLEGPDFGYALEQKVDPRGSLAEFLKSPAGGQIFVSRTEPGVTRGNHYHHSKTEKFLVVEGEAIIRFRSIQQPPSDLRDEVIEHRVSGREFKVVDIPPGYTHSIENVGSGEMVCLFWASEIFDPQKPDTYYVPVLPP